MPKLLIIVSSTRPGRRGEAIAEWFIARAREHGEFDVEVADLVELDLPFLDEPNHPRLRQYTHAHTRAWSEQVEDADAFVFITPEYNHGYPATLKNAIDFLHHEWAHKPVAFVSYGGVAAGTRAVAQLIPIVSVLQMKPLPQQVNIPFFTQFINEDDQLEPNDTMEQAAQTMLDALVCAEAALRPLRDTAAVA